MNALVSDFYTYAGINRESSFLLEALKHHDASTLRYFLRLPELPENQVRRLAESYCDGRSKR